MECNREITISIPEDLYLRCERLNINIADTAVSALQNIIKLKSMESELKKGYEEMAEINLGLAENIIEAENEALEISEQYLLNDLTESE